MSSRRSWCAPARSAAAATDTLTVNGTSGNDAITAARVSGQNQVSVNAQATVGFTGFNVLNLSGGPGNDTFNVAPVGIVMAGTTPAINALAFQSISYFRVAGSTSATRWCAASRRTPTAPRSCC